MKRGQSGITTVSSLKVLNDQITRVNYDDESSTDVPTCFINFEVGDSIKLEIGHVDNAVIVLNGHPYQTIDGFTFFSCGGLLCKLRVPAMESSKSIPISISKSRRRRRS